MSKPLPQGQIPKNYDPSIVENRLYDFWESNNLFTADNESEKVPFVIIMPPPNVTGQLHLGHALQATVEDALIRHRRMKGYEALWLPGTDHAGIATQMIVENKLRSQGTSRQQLGREAFVKQVWEHVKNTGSQIANQHKRLGISCDWSRERFTLDPSPSHAVATTFVNLYKKGLVYRGNRVINWCPRCSTALSDLEVEYQHQDGQLYYIKYPIDGTSDFITVATTRPETMLGDVAVAIHPSDTRYASLHGCSVILPIAERKIPIITDTSIDPEFGTGALKVTPAHDPVDFEIGLRHDLQLITTIDQNGNLSEDCFEFSGMDRFLARDAIVQKLQALGLVPQIDDHQNAVGHCQRCKTIVEPLSSTQWFVKVGQHEDPNSIAGKAYQAVSDGAIRIIPERFTRVYLNWLENIRDWCVSRQLWWGHRIPVWYCAKCSKENVATTKPDVCNYCSNSELTQDPDVLDTWFSSGLWPHSTLGWPEDSADLKYFYPTSVMATGYDILFFWVARMIMLGIENTGEIPFHTVTLTGLIRDSKGVKMSKTKGNVIDPIESIDQYGSDALRFALSMGNGPGNDLRMSNTRLEAGRNFANKIWNATRFVTVLLNDNPLANDWKTNIKLNNVTDQWILSRLQSLIATVDKLWDDLQISEIHREVHDFIWLEFCDWYIELAKVRIRNKDEEVIKVLAYVLESSLRLLHPMMPFITEEAWQLLTGSLPQDDDRKISIMISSYPEYTQALTNKTAESEIATVVDVITNIRNLRAQLKIPIGEILDTAISGSGSKELTATHGESIRQLANINLLSTKTQSSKSNSVQFIAGNFKLAINVGQSIDLAVERNNLANQANELRSILSKTSNKLSDRTFLTKAPQEIIEREQSKLCDLSEKVKHLEDIIDQLSDS